MKRVVLAFGTRPEATKMAPVYQALTGLKGLRPLVLLTGQHKEQLEQSLSLFNIPVHANLDLMAERQPLETLFSRILPNTANALTHLKADYVLVHGDTLTTFAAAWAAFLLRIPTGHVEAGLRSHDLTQPFPEEANRRLTDVLTDLDLAPTALAKSNLLAEGKAAERVIVTGQTGVDAVLQAARVGPFPELPPGPYVTVTMHRRENWPLLGALAGALAQIAMAHPELTFIYPIHLNPVVQEAVRPVLEHISNFVLLPPLAYGPMAALLAKSRLIITDSGGLQEEGASLGVPVVVLRNVTERPEGLEAGLLKLAGNQPSRVFEVVEELLCNPTSLARMRTGKNPYGDGRAGERVTAAVAWRLGLAPRPLDWSA